MVLGEKRASARTAPHATPALVRSSLAAEGGSLHQLGTLNFATVVDGAKLDAAPDIWAIDLPQLLQHLDRGRRGIDDRIDQ